MWASSGAAVQHDQGIQRPQSKHGILRDFTIAQTAAALVPTITSGVILTPSGQRKIISADFTSIPAVDAATRFYFYNCDTDAVERASTYAPTNPTDIFLGALTATGGAIAEYWSGQWVNSQRHLVRQGAALDATGGTYLGSVPYNGAPTYVYELEVRVGVTTTGSGTIVFEKHVAATAAATALGTVSVGAVTASYSAFSGRKKLVLTAPIVLYPGDYLSAKTGTAAGGSSPIGDLTVLTGGSPIIQ